MRSLPCQVGELRSLLAHFPDNLPVVFAYPSGSEAGHDLAGAVTTAFVAEKMGIELVRLDRATEGRIGKCLRFMGWGRKRERVAEVGTGQKQRQYVFRPPEVGTLGTLGTKKINLINCVPTGPTVPTYI